MEGTEVHGRMSDEKKTKWNWKICVAVVSMCMASFCMGTSTGWSSPALPDLNAHRNAFHTSQEQNSWVGGTYLLGALFGGVLGGPFMERIGRKLSTITIMIPCSISWVLIAASTNVAGLYLGRAVNGVCIGVVSCVVPVYIGEISPPSTRGLLGACHQLFICFGILYIYVLGAFLHWTWLCVVSSVFCNIAATSMAFVPESPRWLYSRGRKEAAEFALHWFYGDDADVSGALKELEEDSVACQEKAQLREYLQPVLYKPLLISMCLMFFQQFSGINVVLFFTVHIFQMANSSLDPNVETIVVGVVGVIGTLCSVVTVDLAGRKVLLLTSGAVMMLSAVGMGTFFYVETYDRTFAEDSLTWLPLLSLILYAFGFNFAFGPVPWLMMGELFPARAKGFASSVATGFNWMCGFIITKFFVNISASIGIYGAFWLTTAVCFLSLVFVAFVVPETKGKTLQDIEAIFRPH